MPRVYHVKKARKDNPAVKAGEPYYWWKNRYGPKRYSRTRPRPSQLSSGRKAQIMALQETVQDGLSQAKESYELEEIIESAVADLYELASEYEEGIWNMPEGLQDSPTAESMQEQAENLQMVASELESLLGYEYDTLEEHASDIESAFDQIEFFFG